MPATHCIVLAGGEGRRLGGASKADVLIGGRRLLERVVAGVRPFVAGRIVAVAPDSVDVPPGVLRTLEDPPAGGPLAGIDAGLKALGASADSVGAPVGSPPVAPGSAAFAAGSARVPSAGARDMVFVFAVDTPQAGALAPRLAAAARGRDGAVVVGGEPPFRQCLQAIYRIEALRAAIQEVGRPRNKGVRRTLGGLDLAEVPASADECRDVDTAEDLSWWSKALGSADSGVAPLEP